MRIFVRRGLLPASLLALLAAAPAMATEDWATSGKWAPWIDVEADPGMHRDIGQADGFAPITQNDTSLFFFNPRFRFDDQGSREYNFGLGYRTLWDNKVVLGGYAYLDRDLSPLGNYFNQATFGLEALGVDWKLRANDYQPFGTHDYGGFGPISTTITGGNLLITSDAEHSMQGDDAEIGWRVPVNDALSFRQLWVYGGGYHFDAPGVRDVAGPRARFEYEVGDIEVADRDLRLRLSGEISHDSVRDTQSFIGLRIGIPLGASGKSEAHRALSPLERHMVDPVERDVDIVTGTTTNPTFTEMAVNAYNGQAISGISTVNAGDNVSGKVTAAGADSVVVFNGANGTITIPMNTNITLNTGQTILGGGSILPIRGSRSRAVTDFVAGGTAPTVTGNYTGLGSDGLITLSNNNVIKGMNINNAGGYAAIVSNNASNITITENTISASDNNPVLVWRGNSEGSISNNAITGTGTNSQGILIQSPQPVSIIGNRITVAGNTSVGISTDDSAIIARNTVNISGTDSIGIYNVNNDTANNTVINNNTVFISGAGGGYGGGIRLAGNSSVNSNAIYATDSGSFGIWADTRGNLSGSGNSYSGTNPCRVTPGTTGSVGFVNGSHCP